MMTFREINGIGHLIVTMGLMIFLGVLLFFSKLSDATAMTALGFALGYWYRTTNQTIPISNSNNNSIQQEPPAVDPQQTVKIAKVSAPLPN